MQQWREHPVFDDEDNKELEEDVRNAVDKTTHLTTAVFTLGIYKPPKTVWNNAEQPNVTHILERSEATSATRETAKKQHKPPQPFETV